jgi:ribosomal protein L11 methyltransferase
MKWFALLSEFRQHRGMFVWSKLSSEKWADAWEERFAGAGEQRAVITSMPNRKTIRVEVYCEKKREALVIKKQFGGTVRELKSRNWAALSAVPPPPVKVRDRLVICGLRDAKALAKFKAEHSDRIVINIPPDMAFGTGHHATTATVLRLLVDFAEARRGKPWNMLDLGSGSGLLAIAAEKLGAAEVWGCDFDEKAVKVSLDNLRKNGAKRVVLEVADVLKWKPAKRWDCVAANIFADVLEAIIPKLARAVKKGGIVILSGILRSQAAPCLAVGQSVGLVFDRVITRGKWVTAVAHG